MVQQLQTRAERRFFANAEKNTITIKNNSKFLEFYEELLRISKTMRITPPVPLNIRYGKLGERTFIFYKRNKTSCRECDFIKMFHEDLYNITFLPCRDGVELERFEIYQTGNGIGSSFMELFNSISADLKIPLYLIPGTPGYGETYREDSDPKRRREFYHRHGFKRMKDCDYWKNANTNETNSILREPILSVKSIANHEPIIMTNRVK